MNNLKELTDNYNKAITDVKYLYAIDLLDLLTDEQYEFAWEAYPDLFNPIASEEGEEYIHNPEVLDQLISVFLEILKEDPTNLSDEELYLHIEGLILGSDIAEIIMYYI